MEQTHPDPDILLESMSVIQAWSQGIFIIGGDMHLWKYVHVFVSSVK